MTATRASFGALIVAALAVVGIVAAASADSVTSYAVSRHATVSRHTTVKQQCRTVKHRKGAHAKRRSCAPSGGHRSTTTPKSGGKPCPLCAGGCPHLQQPSSGPGPTALVGGIAVEGGPPSSPEACAHWEAGEVRVANAAGEIVATQKLARGETYDIPVSPGTYTLATPPNIYGFRCESGPFTAVAEEKTPAVVECNIK
jgi:hypothetical protein